ncbi:MAG: hypothetical protein WB014_02145 [Methanosarcina sp.]
MGSAIGLAIGLAINLSTSRPSRRNDPSGPSDPSRPSHRSHPSHSYSTTLYLPPGFCDIILDFLDVVEGGLSKIRELHTLVYTLENCDSNQTSSSTPTHTLMAIFLEVVRITYFRLKRNNSAMKV